MSFSGKQKQNAVSHQASNCCCASRHLVGRMQSSYFQLLQCLTFQYLSAPMTQTTSIQVDLIFSTRTVDFLNVKTQPAQRKSRRMRRSRRTQENSDWLPHLEDRRSSSGLVPLRGPLLTDGGLQSCNLLTA